MDAKCCIMDMVSLICYHGYHGIANTTVSWIRHGVSVAVIGSVKPITARYGGWLSE